jgi:hypothetical protein
MNTIAAKQLRSGDGAMPAAVRRPRWDRHQGLDQRPQLVRYKLISEGGHGAGSCQTYPKGAKRSLTGTWVSG